MGKEDIQNARYISDDLQEEKGAYRNADKALEFLKHNETAAEHTLVDERKLVTRIDWMIVPIMFACYFLQYLDKSLCKPVRTHICKS